MEFGQQVVTTLQIRVIYNLAALKTGKVESCYYPTN